MSLTNLEGLHDACIIEACETGLQLGRKGCICGYHDDLPQTTPAVVDQDRIRLNLLAVGFPPIGSWFGGYDIERRGEGS